MTLWVSFLECIAIKNIVKKIVRRWNLRQLEKLKDLENVTSPYDESEKLISLATVSGGRKQETAPQKKAAKQVNVEREQQAARGKKAAKQGQVEREQQAARKKKVAKRLQIEREQQAARERKAAKQVKIESNQQAAQGMKAAEERVRKSSRLTFYRA
ncbi:hypothetical protein LTR74_017624 [Friedmanniomyces endolithicus]|nr:hypothetical protein LTR74_017624 [Friedmanniomyces endolithicus]